MTEIQPASLARFIRSIAVLASPPEAQLAYLSSIGVPEGVDEIALEFDDGRLLAKQFMSFQWISGESYSKVQLLNSILDRMSGEDHADLWIPQALHEAPEWEEVRSLARELLYSF